MESANLYPPDREGMVAVGPLEPVDRPEGPKVTIEAQFPDGGVGVYTVPLEHSGRTLESLRQRPGINITIRGLGLIANQDVVH